MLNANNTLHDYLFFSLIDSFLMTLWCDMMTAAALKWIHPYSHVVFVNTQFRMLFKLFQCSGW